MVRLLEFCNTEEVECWIVGQCNVGARMAKVV